MKLKALVFGLAVPMTLLSCTSTGTNQLSGDMVSVWSVDRSGAPPFKRQLIEVPAADIAALELETTPVETVTMRVVDFSGKPPFRRTVREVPVIDAASIELESEATGRVRPRPFLKRHW